jgi:hypothetical protein
MQYGSKTFSGCRKISMRLPIDGSGWDIFIAGAALRISESANYESVQSEVWVCKEQSVVYVYSFEFCFKLNCNWTVVHSDE